MVEVLKRLGTRPGVTTELMIATLFTNLLALASPLFVIQVLNRYVTFGVDATLRTLVFGVLIAIVLEFGFREIRMRLAQGLAIKPDEALAPRGLWNADRGQIVGAGTGAPWRSSASHQRCRCNSTGLQRPQYRHGR